ncbi:hypothetical protein, partial [Paraburkholderia ginsengiterrae]|uniref:hypothetical protein n=1 Tax=Paraburkholderia ginsengiterrae TaxID=1462993 RepID=UPI0010422E7D
MLRRRSVERVDPEAVYLIYAASIVVVRRLRCCSAHVILRLSFVLASSMTTSTRSDTNRVSQPLDVEHQQAGPVLTAADTERLRTSRIVGIEGTVTDMTEEKLTVITGASQYGSNHGTLKVFRFNVAGKSLVLYAAQSGITNYSLTPTQFELSNGTKIRLAVASEDFAGEHVVYGVHEPRSKRVYVAFAVMALPGQSNKNVRLQAVGDLPRI